MAETPTAQVTEAQDAVVALIRAIPDAALDWQPGDDAWSLKRTIAHVAHAYDFYLLIIEQTRASDFGTVGLRPEQPGWQHLVATDEAVLRCTTVAETFDQLESAYQRALAVFSRLAPDELDRAFVLTSWRPDVAPETTTLRVRVLETAASHLREHQSQLAETLAHWRAATAGGAPDE
jgi:uncharacterized damage-inducible protein DinB